MPPAARRPCPTCGREIEWSDRFPYRPFCSERCRVIDLGGWLSEKHAIPGDQAEAGDETRSDGMPTHES